MKLTIQQIRDSLRNGIGNSQEACAVVLSTPDGEPYILEQENLAVESGMATTKRALFAMPSAEIWDRVWNRNHELLAVLHNHPDMCPAMPSITDRVKGSVMSWYKRGETVHTVHWVICNDAVTRAWDINPQHLNYNEMVAACTASTPTSVVEVPLETLTWLDKE